MGQRLVLHRDDEHPRELEPLCRVQRHQLDLVIGIFECIGIGDQRGLFEIQFERPVVGMLAIELHHLGDQFTHVPFAIHIIAAVGEPIEVGVVLGFIDDTAKNAFDGRGRLYRQLVVKRDETADHRHGAGPQALDPLGIASRVQQGDPFPIGVTLQPGQGLRTDSPRRRVDDPFE